MTDFTVTRPITRAPTHPGELMREILDEHVKLPIAEAARRMEVSRPSLYAALKGTGAVTPDLALRFARLTGGAADLYVQMQSNRDLWLAEQRLRDKLTSIVPAGQTAAATRDQRAQLVEEILQANSPRALYPAEIRNALQRDKGVSMAFNSIRHALGQVAEEVENTGRFQRIGTASEVKNTRRQRVRSDKAAPGKP